MLLISIIDQGIELSGMIIQIIKVISQILLQAA